VLFRNRTHRSLWLALLVASAAGGWYCGRSQRIFHTAAAGAASTSPDTGVTKDASRPPFPAGSPRASWMERVKNAKPADFPKLNLEWNEVFPEDDQYEEYHAPNALAAYRWMIGVWLVKDSDGFLMAASSVSFEHYDYAAQALVELMPENAAAWIFRQRQGDDEYFFSYASSELAKQHPALYLKVNPEGTKKLTPDNDSDDDWGGAIANLAKTNAVAAGNACLRWKVENDHGTFYDALLAVAAAWKPTDPPISEWAKSIGDPWLRDLANHAWLSALAVKDPKAALKELYATTLEVDNNLYRDAPGVVLEQLARADPLAALKLMKDLEGDFSETTEYSASEENGQKSSNPFRNLGPWSESRQDSVMRHDVLNSVAENLPDDPAGLIAAIRKLTHETDGDASWKLGVEAYLIRSKSARWSADDCLAVANQWAAESNATHDDATLKALATRTAIDDPEKAFALLETFPEQARSFLTGEIIQRLPSSDTARRIELLGQLPAAQWNRDLGETLGRDGGDYAPLVAALPADVTCDVTRAFTRKWAEQNPEAVVEWVETLPAEAARQVAAEGLADGWVRYDADAATAWAESLPDGSVRDVVAESVSYWFSMGHSADAWHWADSITNPEMRAKAYNQVAIYWRTNVPEEFRAAHDKARQEAGLPAYEPQDDSGNPFK
jgi:hypothetical protein